jgi:hypothetical protein
MKIFTSPEKKFAFFTVLTAVLIGCSLVAPVVVLTASDMRSKSSNLSNLESEYVAKAGVSEAVTRLGNGEIYDPEKCNPDWRAEIYVGMERESSPPTYRYTSYQNDLYYGTPKHPVTVRYLLARGKVVYYDPDERTETKVAGDYPVYVIEATGGPQQAAAKFKGEYVSYPFNPHLSEPFICGSKSAASPNGDFCRAEHSEGVPVFTRIGDCAKYHVGEGKPASGVDAVPSIGDLLGVPMVELGGLLNRSAVNRNVDGNPRGITYIWGDAVYRKGVLGSGLLYVTGNLIVKGDFCFNGLVYVEGNCSFSGNVWVLGSFVVRGHCNVRPTVLLSRQAVVESVRNQILIDLSAKP